MNIEEGNKLIVEFLGQEFIKTKFFKDLMDVEFNLIDETDYYFHSSWDWLMPVVEKIEDFDDSENHYSWVEDETKRSNFADYSVDIETNTCTIDLNFELDPSICIVHTRADTKIQAVWQAVVRFIQRKNEYTSSLQST